MTEIAHGQHQRTTDGDIRCILPARPQAASAAIYTQFWAIGPVTRKSEA